MKQQSYNLTMSDGSFMRIESAISAGDAINQGLWQKRGLKVRRCFTGELGQDRRYPIGCTDYDVPEHNPVAVDAVKTVNRKPKDRSEVMSFMEEIK